MNRIYSVLLCLILSGCGSNPASKPSFLLNAENYSNDAMQAYVEEDWVRAQQLFNRALSLNQSMDERLGTLTSHINLAEVALALHNKRAADKHLTRAAKIVKTDALKSYQPRITLLYASLAMQQKQAAKAIQFLHELLPVFSGDTIETMPDAIQLAAISMRTEIAFQKMQNESLWTSRYGNALKKIANQGTAKEARLLRFQSQLLLRLSDYAEAEVGLQQALVIYKKNLLRSGIAATLFELGALYEKQNDWQTALSYLKRSVTVFRSLRNDDKLDKVTAMLAKVESEIVKP